MTAPTPAWNTTRRDAQWAARQLVVIQYPYTVPLITSVHNPTTGAMVLPAGGYPIGLHRKSEGGRLANAQTLNDIRAHGVGGPTRQIPSQRDINLGLRPFETHRINLENFWGEDWSAVQTDVSGGVVLPISELPINKLSRVLLIGKDDWNGLPWWIVWIANRVNISQTGEQQLTDAEVADYPYTMNFQGEDNLLGQPAIVDIFGPGWLEVQTRADLGFMAGITGITIAPTTKTLTVAAGANHTQQLAVTDSNLVDRTNDAVYVSSNSAVVSVTNAGLITGLAVSPALVNEVQTVTITGAPTGGTFTLTYSGQTTTGIAHSATAATVQTALEALSNIGVGDVAVTGGPGPGTAWVVTFQGALAATNVGQMVADGALLTGGTTPAASVATTTQGVPATKVTATLSGFTAACTVTVTA